MQIARVPEVCCNIQGHSDGAEGANGIEDRNTENCAVAGKGKLK